MHLSEEDQQFLEKRKRLLGSWKYAGALLLCIVIGMTVYLYLQSPLMINFMEVKERIKADDIDPGTRDLMLVFLPLVSNTVCFLLLTLVCLMYVSFGMERKYQAVIDKLMSGGRE
ncbi:MAG: hypothetical protein KDA65_06085 [Planctomycetaceae bacterium]|nr:hypothetical protein [Planctomycetaceae bacterium]